MWNTPRRLLGERAIPEPPPTLPRQRRAECLPFAAVLAQAPAHSITEPPLASALPGKSLSTERRSEQAGHWLPGGDPHGAARGMDHRRFGRQPERMQDRRGVIVGRHRIVLHPGPLAVTPTVHLPTPHSAPRQQLRVTVGPVIAASDYVCAVPESIRAFIPAGRIYKTLGTDGFGRSDTRAALRKYFGVDAASIADVALKSL